MRSILILLSDGSLRKVKDFSYGAGIVSRHGRLSSGCKVFERQAQGSADREVFLRRDSALSVYHRRERVHRDLCPLSDGADLHPTFYDVLSDSFSEHSFHLLNSSSSGVR